VHLLTRFIFAQTLFACLAGVALFVFIFITGNAVRDIIGLLAAGQITAPLFFELLWLLVPHAVSYSMPMGMLMGILMVMGRMSASLELTAMRAAGLSLWRIATPVLAVACLGTGAAFYINSFYTPSARAAYKSILNDVVRTDPLRFIVPRTFIHDFPGYVIYVSDKQGDDLRGFWLWELDEENRAVRLLRAESGGFTYDPESDALILTLREGFTELRDPKSPDDLKRIQPLLTFRDASLKLPLEHILKQANRPRDISHMNLRALIAKRDALRAETLTAAAESADAEALAFAQRESVRVQYHANRKIAMAFSILAFAVIGIPLGIKASRSETYANMGLALGIALVYYLGLVFVDWAEYSPAARPDILVWIPNLICQVVGVALLVRASRGVTS